MSKVLSSGSGPEKIQSRRRREGERMWRRKEEEKGKERKEEEEGGLPTFNLPNENI